MAAQAPVCLRKPSQTTDTLWLEAYPPNRDPPEEESVGKWLIFKELKNIDRMWEKVRKMITSGELKASKAEVATKGNCENARDSNIKVIKVRTSERYRDEVGLKLVPLVCKNIRYKLDSATNAGFFTHQGHGKVTSAECQWNDGNPKVV